MELTTDIVNSYEMKKTQRRGDLGDKSWNYVLPKSKIKVSGYTMLFGEPQEIDCLEGMSGYLLIDSEEDLNCIYNMNFEEVCLRLKNEYPEFDTREVLECPKNSD